MLTEAQISEMIQVLTSRLTSTKCDRTKKALLVTLERLGVATDRVLLTILPHLVDTNVSTTPSHIVIHCLVHIVNVDGSSQFFI